MLRRPSRPAPRRAAALVGALLTALLLPAVPGPAAAVSGPAATATGTATPAAGSAELGERRGSAEEAAAALADEVAALRTRAAAAADRLEALHAQLEHDVPTARAAAETFDTAVRLDAAERSARADRARDLYMAGGEVALYAHLLDAADVHDLLVRLQVTRIVLDADAQAERVRGTALHRAAEERARLEVDAGSAARLEAEAADAAAEVTALLAEQERLLAEAGEEVRRLVDAEQQARAREAAERAAAEELAKARARDDAARAAAASAASAAGAATGDGGGDLVGARFAAAPPIGGAGMACPVGAVHSFSDTWNAPRSGGRRHQGTDVFAPEGSPAYAVADGVVDKASDVERGLGGITLWIRSDAGDRYYYAHNSRNLVRVGQRVAAGDVVALVGRTGNARSTPPHIHFELHPGGGAAANPYALLRRLCG